MLKIIKFEVDEKNTSPYTGGDIETLTEDLDRVEYQIEDLKETLRYALEKQVILSIEVKKWGGIKW